MWRSYDVVKRVFISESTGKMYIKIDQETLEL